MGTDDLRDLQEIRNVRLHRLRLLEKRQAVEGFATPPEVILEIASTRKELAMVENVLSNPMAAETVDAIGSTGQYLALDKKLDLVVKMLGERMDRMEETSLEWRTTERQARYDGQHLYRRLMVAAFLLSMLAFGIGTIVLLLHVRL